jgi:hypothetical protein
MTFSSLHQDLNHEERPWTILKLKLDVLPIKTAWMASHPQFISEDTEGFIFQRFDRLTARNLLYLQSDLNELEAKLDDLDMIDAQTGEKDAKARLSAKAYSDLKAKAQRHAKKAEKANGIEETAVQNEAEYQIEEDAYDRVYLHKQIKEALRDYCELPSFAASSCDMRASYELLRTIEIKRMRLKLVQQRP